MAITFIQQKKRLRYLILTLAALISVLSLIAWQIFFIKEKAPLPDKAIIKKVIEINYSVLENEILKSLSQFESIPVYEKETIRENPFEPPSAH